MHIDQDNVYGVLATAENFSRFVMRGRFKNSIPAFTQVLRQRMPH